MTNVVPTSEANHVPALPLEYVPPRNAVISNCGLYRYWLLRVWDDNPRKNFILWVMLNPSTADATQDDPTIRRCVGFSKAWGFDGLLVCNLYAFRATKPAELWKTTDPIGPENDFHLSSGGNCSKKIVIAWGRNGASARRAEVLRILRKYNAVHCLGKTNDGSPRHPLYVKGDTQLQVFV